MQLILKPEKDLTLAFINSKKKLKKIFMIYKLLLCCQICFLYMIYSTVHYCPHLCYHNNNDEDNRPSVKIINFSS